MLLLGSVLNYKIYLKRRDRNKYIRVSISKSKFGHTIHRRTCIILTEYGGAVCLKNSTGIPENDMDKLIEIIEANHKFICEIWKGAFGSIRFYC